MNGEDTTETPSPRIEGASKAPVVQRGAQAWGAGSCQPPGAGTELLTESSHRLSPFSGVDSYLRNVATVYDPENIEKPLT